MGKLSGHALGNLLIAALWQETGDIVVGLVWVAALLGAHGRVLPVATTALDVVADVRGLAGAAADDVTRVHGQVAVATCGGTVVDLHLLPEDVGACAPAVEAVAEADVVVLGPGSWYTSVLAPLLVPGIAEAIAASHARVVVILNVGSHDREVIGLPPEEHLRVLAHHVPGLRLSTVLAEASQIADPGALRTASADLGAELVLAHVCARDGSPRHDVDLLASALGGVLLPGG